MESGLHQEQQILHSVLIVLLVITVQVELRQNEVLVNGVQLVLVLQEHALLVLTVQMRPQLFKRFVLQEHSLLMMHHLVIQPQEVIILFKE